MIPVPSGWLQTWQADHFLLISPNRPVGVLRYREPWGPLTTMRWYLDQRIPRLPVLEPEIDEVHPIERVTTDEGEHAAVARVDLRCAFDRTTSVKRPAIVVFGVVFGDTFMTSLDGLCLSPDHFDELHDTVRDLTRRTVLMLGTLRRRRYVYRMPEGWQGVDSFWGTRFIPPEYPNVGAMITVHAALPTSPPHTFVETVGKQQVARDATIEHLGEATPLKVTKDLTGFRWQLVSRQPDGTERRHVVVELADGRFNYRLKLDRNADDRAAAADPIFDALCASIEPVPTANQAVASTAAGTLDFWAE